MSYQLVVYHLIREEEIDFIQTYPDMAKARAAAGGYPPPAFITDQDTGNVVWSSKPSPLAELRKRIEAEKFRIRALKEEGNTIEVALNWVLHQITELGNTDDKGT